MGSSFQPPIHLDPTQDANQQTAFVNQNFQTLASALETNSFRIVESGQTTLPASSAPVSLTTVTHGLGFAPTPFGFLTNQTFSIGTTVISTDANIPLPTETSTLVDGVDVKFLTYIRMFSDDQNLYFVLYNSTGSSTGPYNVLWYLTQIQAGN